MGRSMAALVVILRWVTATPFGPAWEDLSLHSLRRFLETAIDESLTWEAKGRDIRPQLVRKCVTAFANSTLGGFLVLGASFDRAARTWSLDGWQPPTEPILWVTGCLANGGVTPLPSTDARAWPVGEGRFVAVVMVRPVAVPPAITSSGEVYERLSSASVPVTNSSSLRRLFERGEAALARSARASEDGRHDLSASPPAGRQCKLVVSLASAALPGDAAALVFRDSLYRAMMTELNGPLANQPAPFNRLDTDVSQHALSVWNMGFSEDEGYAIRIGRHGSVAISQSANDIDSGLRLMADSVDALRPLWGAAMRLLAMLTPAGPVHAAMRFYDNRQGDTDMSRWTDLAGPWDDMLESILREARRALGRTQWEPESP